MELYKKYQQFKMDLCAKKRTFVYNLYYNHTQFIQNSLNILNDLFASNFIISITQKIL